ncbi:MAG: GDP-mannose 4,6-dehydratase [Saprospiraceae bacterium]|nr:GDP-mannose 4,6-dehydratase [Saprospiraceae bacterium]
MNKILLTGGAGFIGYHLADSLIRDASNVVYIIDNLNSYYDVSLKEKRLTNLGISDSRAPGANWVTSSKFSNLFFCKVDITDSALLSSVVADLHCDYIIHLAAQAGVRYSFQYPETYIQSNLLGFFQMMELAKLWRVKHFIFASSSSVYGGNLEVPFSEDHSISKPLNLYAATKASNELLAYAYANLYKIPTSALRFFTVYGPYGRPDMAYFKFMNMIVKGQVLDVFGQGNLQRDFTHISDIVISMSKLLDAIPGPNQYFEIYNIGNNQPVELMHFIQLLEKYSGHTAQINKIESFEGEMKTTFANIDKLVSKIHYRPQMNIERGLKEFVSWYLSDENPLIN